MSQGAGELLTLAGHIYLPAIMKDPRLTDTVMTGGIKARLKYRIERERERERERDLN